MNDGFTSPQFINELTLVILTAFVLERALATIFEWRLWPLIMQRVNTWMRRRFAWELGDDPPVKVPLAIGASWLLCSGGQIDLVKQAMIAAGHAKSGYAEVTPFGTFLTALVVAGGSQAAIKLFQDFLGFSRASRELVKEARQVEFEARKAELEQQKQLANLERERMETERARQHVEMSQLQNQLRREQMASALETDQFAKGLTLTGSTLPGLVGGDDRSFTPIPLALRVKANGLTAQQLNEIDQLRRDLRDHLDDQVDKGMLPTM